MSKGINKVILIGNLGSDPEIRHMPNGNAVANLSLATSESWKDKQTGQKQEKVEWHRVTTYNRLAEIAGEYLKKGSKIYIEGRLQTRKWQGQDGADRYTTEVIANDMQFLDSRPSGGGQYDSGAPSANHAPQHQQGSAQDPQQGFDGLDDPIPF